MTVAASALSVVLAGCSSSSTGNAATPADTASPTPSSGPEAVKLAKTAMAAVKSYAFRVKVTQSGAHPSTFSASGVVQVPSAVNGVFTSNGHTLRVLSGPDGEFVKAPGSPWRHKAKVEIHPLQWDKVLAAVGDAQLVPAAGAATWRISSHPSAALSTVLVLTATSEVQIEDVQLTLDLDGHYRILRMEVVATGVDGGKQVTLRETVTASGYDAQKPVPTAPPTGAT